VGANTVVAAKFRHIAMFGAKVWDRTILWTYLTEYRGLAMVLY